jgi:hypothetical protein
MDCETIVTYAKDIALVVSAGVASTVAIIGLGTWKKQISGKTEYDTARRLLKALYGYREAISTVRNPFIPVGEMPQPPEGHPFSTDDKRKYFYGIASAYEKRWSTVIEARIKLDSELLEAEVLWGSEFRKKFVELFKTGSKLFATLKLYLDSLNPEADVKLKYEFDVLYASDEQTDKYATSLQDIIGGIEAFLRPYLNRKNK